MATSVPDQLTPRARESSMPPASSWKKPAKALSVRRVAQRLGIRAPSLYKHLPDKQTLQAAIIPTGFEERAALSESALEVPRIRSERSPGPTAISPTNPPASTA